MNSIEFLSPDEKKMFECFEKVDKPDSIWGIAIGNVVKNPDPVRFRMLVSELKSQAADCEPVILSILGHDCYEHLIKI